MFGEFTLLRVWWGKVWLMDIDQPKGYSMKLLFSLANHSDLPNSPKFPTIW